MSHPHELLQRMAANTSAVNPQAMVDLSARSTNDFMIAGLLSLCTLIGGPLNLWVLGREVERIRQRNFSSTVLIRLHLNISDLLVLLVYCPSKAIWQLVFDWRGGEFLCKLVKFGHELAFQSSSTILACIALDRALAILRPFAQAGPSSRSRLRLLTTCGWAYSIFFSFKNFFFWTTMVIPNDPYHRIQCTTWPIRQFMEGSFTNATLQYEMASFVVHLVTSFYVPLAVILTCYSIILLHVWRHYRSPELRGVAVPASTHRFASTLSRVRGKGAAKAPPAAAQLELLSKAQREHKSQPRNGLHVTTSSPLQTPLGPSPSPPSEPLANGIQDTRANGAPAAQADPLGDSVRLHLLPPTSSPTPKPPAQKRTSIGQLRIHIGTAGQRLIAPMSGEQKLKLRTLMTTAILITAYIACWLPYQLVAVWPYIHEPSFSHEKRQMMNTVCLFLLTLNSVINPLIYGIYRAEMTKAWRRFKRRWLYNYHKAFYGRCLCCCRDRY